MDTQFEVYRNPGSETDFLTEFQCLEIARKECEARGFVKIETIETTIEKVVFQFS
jgi:hypothetical protein